MPSSMSADIKQQFIDADQSHLFQYWDELTSEEQLAFLNQLSQFPDPAHLVETVKQLLEQHKAVSQLSGNFEPLPEMSCSSLLTALESQVKLWELKGLELISQGQVGVLLMAGGQGTRLGSSNPKGCYDIGLPSHKSLFQLQAEKLLKITQLAKQKFGVSEVAIPWYIMTSSLTRLDTENFFIENDYFGLNKSDVIFFNQGTLPCFSLDGSKILLESKGAICEGPDGNGGLYKGIYTAKLLEDFQKRNIKHIHMYCVDNCLLKVADPIFIGWSAVNGYQLSTKVVRKRNSSESVGLIVLDTEQNCPRVIEYSEISKELSEKTNDDGSLYLKLANIVNHYYSVDLLQKEIINWISSQQYLPFHIAKKKILSLDTKTGQQVTPQVPNGIKLEQFIFDVFPAIPLSKFGCLEVDRHEEFSPLKNGPGSANDCPETARNDSLLLGTKWVTANGGLLESDSTLVEVSASTSYSGEGLEKVKGQLFTNNQII